MIKEEIIKHLHKALNSVDITFPYRYVLVEAIEALSQPSLPSNLDKAAIDAAQLDMQYRQIMEATNDERLRYSRIFRRGFKSGVEWIAAQGITVTGDTDDEYIRILEDIEKAICKIAPDSTINVQIRK